MKLLWIIWTLFAVTKAYVIYPIYFLDERCRHGDEFLTYDLGDLTGPNGRRLVSAFVLNATNTPPYLPHRNCTIQIVPHPSSHGIVLSIRKIEFKSSSISECTDYIQIYSNDDALSKRLCDFTTDFMGSRSYSSSGPMFLWYHTGKRTPAHISQSGFEFTVTEYNKNPCNNDEFLCNNQRCIWKSLTCDGFNNCGDRSDETHMACFSGRTKKPNFAEFYLIFISMCVIVTLIAIVTTAFYYVRKWRRRSSSEELASDHFSIDPPVDRPPPYTATAETTLTSPRTFTNSHSSLNKEEPPPYEP